MMASVDDGVKKFEKLVYMILFYVYNKTPQKAKLSIHQMLVLFL